MDHSESERIRRLRPHIEARLGRSIGQETIQPPIEEVLGYKPSALADIHDVLDEVAKALGLQCSEGVGGFSSPPERCSLPEGHDGPHEA